MIVGSLALAQLAPPLSAFLAARTAVRAVHSVVERKPIIDSLSDEGLQPLVKSQGAIEIMDVSFAYPSRPDSYVCRDYTLSIAPGETVALVGASGCGKVSGVFSRSLSRSGYNC
jgi:ABC-type multidrug transport system fused ATPase/permease subunit